MVTTLLETKRAQLAEVQQAISAVLTRGAAYTITDGGAQRQLTRANIKNLQDRETKLEREVAALERAEAGGSGIRINYGMPR